MKVGTTIFIGMSSWRDNRSGDRRRLEHGWALRRCGSGPASLRQSGRLTGQGTGVAWKAIGTARCEIRVLSLPPSRESYPERPPALSRKQWVPRGMAIDTSAFRHFPASTADVPAVRAGVLRDARTPYVSFSWVCRELENPDGCNPSPMCCAGSNPCHTHQAREANLVKAPR